MPVRQQALNRSLIERNRPRETVVAALPDGVDPTQQGLKRDL